jgi:putative membrane protein
MRGMHPLAQAAAVLAAVIHGYFFLMESVWFMHSRVWSRFGLGSVEQAEVVRSFAYNQGFYNLFLAIGVALGIVLMMIGNFAAGRALVLFACSSMVAAGVVLVAHDRRFLRAGAIQALPPLVAVVVAILLT